MEKQMTVKEIKLIREILKDVLTEPLKNHGYKFKLGNATYDEDSVKFNGFRISYEQSLSEEQKALKAELEWRDSVDFVKSLDAERVAEIDGMALKLWGYKRKARKQPFIVENVNNGDLRIISESVAERLYGIAS